MLKKTLNVIGIVFIFAMVISCATKKEPEAKELQGTVKSEVLEHKGSSLGINELPVWVQTYIQNGITGLEKSPDYKDDYCFVAETTASNLDAGQVWVNSFNMPETIARNVSTRVEATFSGAASGDPKGVYGTYFENIVKTSSSIEYSGVRKINDWWVLVRRYNQDNKSKFTDEYRIYVLYTIERDLLDRQVVGVIDRVTAGETVDAGKKEAVDKVKALIAKSGL